jgi:hypothetical protein
LDGRFLAARAARGGGARGGVHGTRRLLRKQDRGEVDALHSPMVSGTKG